MGGEVSTNFKSSNGIEISRLVQVLLNFDWFWGSPWGVGGGEVGGWGCGVVSGYTPHMCTCMCMHAHTRTHMHIWHHREFPGIPPVGVHVCTCVHVHVCGGHPPTTPHPQSCREPETPNFNKSWTNRDNLILFEDSLPLNIPELI